MPSAGSVPEKVNLAMANYYSDYIYISGGYGPSLTGKFYRYNLLNYSWENITNNSYYNLPVQAQSVLFGECLYILFGANATSFFPSIYYVSLTAHTWQWESLSLDYSYTRYGQSSVRVSDLFYLFGGASVDTYNDLLVLNLSVASLSPVSLSYKYPSVRSNHGLALVNGNFLLFGGLGASGYLGDLWQFDLEAETWLALSPFGTLPSPRHLYASSSFGDALLVWGGEDSTGLLNDFNIYNARTNVWTSVSPLSLTTPGPRRGACAVFKMPLSYLFGGETQNGYSNELWGFDIRTSEYALISNAGTGIAYANCQIVNDQFLVLFGVADGELEVFGVNSYNFTEGLWYFNGSLQQTSGGAQGIGVKLQDKLVYFGGRDFSYLSAYKTLNVDYMGANYKMITDKNPYNMGFGQYKTRLYYSNGGSVNIYRNLNPFLYDTILAYVELNSLFPEVAFECSPGTWFNGTQCEICPAGTYSEDYGNDYCLPCAPGRFNDVKGATSSRQCYPCPEGTVSQDSGQRRCLDCPHTYHCPPGSTTPQLNPQQIAYASVQPLIYPVSENASEIYYLTIYLCIGLFSILAILLVPTIRKKIMNIDLYTIEHNFELDVPIIKRKTMLGGVFTLMFLITAAIFIATALLQYFLQNITEVKSLQPLVVLEKEISIFATDLEITVSFLQYSESCAINNLCSSSISFETANILPSSSSFTSSITCSKSSEGTCEVQYSCKSCTIDTTAAVAINMNEDYSFAGGISVLVSSNSSIPASKSSITTGLFAEGTSVLIGPIASAFYFTMTPSLFTSDLSDFPSPSTGYHISLTQPPVAGSQTPIDDLSYISGLGTVLYLETSTSGLNTQRFQTQTFMNVVSAVLGSVAGVMGTVGFLLHLTEKKQMEILDRRETKKHHGKIVKARYALKAAIPELHKTEIAERSRTRYTTLNRAILSIISTRYPEETETQNLYV